MAQIVDISQSLYRIWSVGLRVIRQTKRDRRTVGALIINPLILMLLIGYAFSGTFTGINLGIVELNMGPVQENVLSHLQASNIFSITYLASESEARKLISDETLNGAIVLGKDEIGLLLDGTSPQVAGSIATVVEAGMQAAAMQMLSQSPAPAQIPAITQHYVYGYDLEVKDSVGPALLGVTIFFFTSLNTTIGFLRERLQGTLEKVMVSPLNRMELVSGYILAYLVLSIAQSVITFVILVVGFKVPIGGNLLAVLVIVVLLSAGSLSFGAVLSNFVTTEFQVMQLNPVVTFPQTILSGAWVPIQSIPDWLRPLSYIFPLTYASDALKLTLLKGASLTDILYPDIFALLIFFIVTFFVATFMIKKEIA